MQIACYSGHKRMSCLIYQTVTTPDGLIFSFYGPEVGRRHDLTLLRNSGLNNDLESCLNTDFTNFRFFLGFAINLKAIFIIIYYLCCFDLRYQLHCNEVLPSIY